MRYLTYLEIDVPEFNDDDTGEKFVIPGAEYDFSNNTANGWSASGLTLTPSTSGLLWVATGADPIMRISGLSIDGSTERYVAIDVERTAVRTVGVWEGTIYYTTAGHSESGSFRKSFPELANVIGTRETIFVDMHNLTAGGTDWATNIITGLRLDLENGPGTPNGQFKIHSITVGERLQTFRFTKPCDYLPDDIEAIPSIADISYTPSVISLGKDLGMRAVLDTTFQDHRHIFGDDVYTSGSFWGKFRARYGLRLRGREVRWFQGIVGQSLDQMEVRYFTIDSTSGPDLGGKYKIIAKDILKFADGDRAQAPRLSQGFIAGSLSNSATSVSLSPAGIGNAEYPASGYICIGGNEIVSFTRSSDALTMVRGLFNTTAVAHDAGSRMQLCLRYDAVDPAVILSDLFRTYADVDADFIPDADWQAETGAYLQRVYTAMIPEPTAVNQLISEVIEQAALAVWWEPLEQQIKLQVLRSIPATADAYTPENVIAGSLAIAEQPNARVSEVWVYFGQRDPTRPLDEIDNYRSTAITADLEAEDDYGGAAIKKIMSRWIPFGGLTVAQRLGQIQLARFKDPPRRFAFDVFRPYDGTLPPALGGGYQITAWPLQDMTGASSPAPVQIVKQDPKPDHYSVEGEEILFASFDPDDLTNRVVTINSDVANVNLRDLHDDLYPAITGTESPAVNVTCIITSGAIVSSSNPANPAFEVGSWPVGVDILLQVQGRIQGAGGDGGFNAFGPDGIDGGTALYTRYAISLDNATGKIYGGGGGGGRARGSSAHPEGGGGGGAGRVAGAAGVSNDNDGQPGTLDAGGAGGVTASAIGGAGGGLGQAGANGNGSSGGTGGAAGSSIDGVSFVTPVGGAGDRLGPQIN